MHPQQRLVRVSTYLAVWAALAMTAAIAWTGWHIVVEGAPTLRRAPALLGTPYLRVPVNRPVQDAVPACVPTHQPTLRA